MFCTSPKRFDDLTRASYKLFIRFIFACFIGLFLYFPLPAQRLPFKKYTTEHGLPQNIINRVVRDSRGFLWFCTEDGLSRFDGQVFVNYDTSNGLPHPQVNHILEARDGVYWLATNGGGVVRFDVASKPSSSLPFTVVPILSPTEKNLEANRVNYVYQDRAGTIWAGTFWGVYRLESEDGSFVFRRVALPNNMVVSVRGFTEDESGNLWMWSRNGAFRRQADGRITHYSISPGEKYDPLRKILSDGQGKIWIAHEEAGLFIWDLQKLALLEQAHNKENYSIDELKPAVSAWHGKGKGLETDLIFSLFQAADSHIWIGTANGLTEFDGQNFYNYTTAQGLPETPYNWINEDVNGNIWATTNQGAIKLTRRGFTTYQQNEGFGVRGVRSIWEGTNGELQILTPTATFNQQSGGKFMTTKLQLPLGLTFESPQNAILDSESALWIATKIGLIKFSKFENFKDLPRITPQKIEGLPGDFILNLFEDSRRNVWISIDNAERRLALWERASDTVRTFTETDGLPTNFAASAFVEDSSQTVWLGGFNGGLVRYRNGRFTHFDTASGAPFGQVQSLFIDSQKRLWIATKGGGVGKATELEAENPSFTTLTVKNGISSNTVFSVTEDAWGRIYLGTGRGLDWLEPNGGRAGRYSTVDGLNDDKIEIAFRDRNGALWFGTANSLAKFVPQPPRPLLPSEVFITKLRVGENNVPLAVLGQSEIGGIEIVAGGNQVVVDFAAIDFAAGQTVRFQHKLVGAESDWNEPTFSRTVNFANLAAGDYQFMVRAVTPDGATSEKPAVVSFRVLPPVYLRWWFLTIAAVLVGILVYTIYRRRVARLVELERVRIRIATDLHDDIGSNLSKISLLSEVAKMQANGNGESKRLLNSIAEISRNSVDSMRDIVWAISPSRDSLLDLTRKMRGHAEETFVPNDVEVAFNAPSDGKKVKLTMDTRRELYLVYKEAINNAAKHSGCQCVKIDFALEERTLNLTIRDDGRGFDTAQDFDGNGLANMKNRVKKIGGKINIESAVGTGTILKIHIPQR